MPRLSIDTLALDARLGRPRGTTDAAGQWHCSTTDLPRVSLIDLPRECARRDIGLIDVRSSHLPRVDDIYLTDFQATCSASDVVVSALVIDEPADLAQSDTTGRYEAVGRLKPWIDRASLLQAECVRLEIGIGQPTDEPAETLVESLQELAELAHRAEVKLLLSGTVPGPWRNKLCDAVRADIHFAADLDGRRDPTLLADASRATLLATWRSRVEALIAEAASLTLPGDFSAIVADPTSESNTLKTLDVLAQAMKDRHFAGPLTLSQARSRPADEWAHLTHLRDLLRQQRVVRSPAPFQLA